MAKTRVEAEHLSALMNMALAEVGEPNMNPRRTHGGREWSVFAPVSGLNPNSKEIRHRAVQLARMRMGTTPECMACWWAGVEARNRRDWERADEVRAACCGMIGCPGPMEA